FAIITTDSNELVAEIHDRMPVILAPADYARWLGEEPDPRDLMRPFPAESMRMWPISTRVNNPENDDRFIVEPVELATDAAYDNSRALAVARTRDLICSMTRATSRERGCSMKPSAPSIPIRRRASPASPACSGFSGTLRGRGRSTSAHWRSANRIISDLSYRKQLINV